jgi:hypothetical protein
MRLYIYTASYFVGMDSHILHICKIYKKKKRKKKVKIKKTNNTLSEQFEYPVEQSRNR